MRLVDRQSGFRAPLSKVEFYLNKLQNKSFLKQPNKNSPYKLRNLKRLLLKQCNFRHIVIKSRDNYYATIQKTMRISRTEDA